MYYTDSLWSSAEPAAESATKATAVTSGDLCLKRAQGPGHELSDQDRH